MRVTFAIDDTMLAAEDLAWEERYIEGTASLEDLLKYACVYAKARSNRKDAVNFARASIGLEGLKLSAAEEERAHDFINGEISLAEFTDSDS